MGRNGGKKTAAEWLVGGLRERGVEWVATLCGHGLDPFFAAADAGGLRLVDTRNEQSAGYMADVYGRLTGKPGVCAVSSGVAVANALSGVVNSWLDGAPMLLISGAADGSRLGMGAFQDLDHVTLARPVTRWSQRLDQPSRVLHALDEAWHAASQRLPLPGPVHLMLPMDVQRAVVAEGDLVEPVPAELAAMDAGDPAAVGKALLQAKRPLIVAGSGVFYAGEGSALRAFAERHAIPVVAPIWDRGVFDAPSEAFAGVVGAATGGAGLQAEADCLVMAGAAPDYRMGYLQPDAMPSKTRIIGLTRGWKAVDRVYSDGKGQPKTEWLRTARRKVEAYRKQVEQRGREQARKGMHSIDVVQAIAEVLPSDGLLLMDGGSIGQWAHQLLCTNRYPSHWLPCGRSGVVGWGLGGAMAARLAYPKRAVVLLSGDGAFTFTVAEIECAVRQRLPYVAIVVDDESWGITETGHKKQFGRAIGSHLGPIDFAGLAQSLGARGVRASTAEGVAVALRQAIKHDGVTVIHVPVVGGNPS